MAARKQEAMKIRGKLTGKKLAGIIWSGHGSQWTAKENYFQLEDEERISVWLRKDTHTFWIRFNGQSVEITLNRSRRKVVARQNSDPPSNQRDESAPTWLSAE